MQTTRLTRILALSLAALTILMVTGCGRANEQQTKTPPPPAVTVEVVAPNTFAHTIQLTGSVEAATVATLSSPAEGPVLALATREGDAVKRDDVLLVIGRKSSADAALASAREEVTRQEREFARVESLVADRAMPGSQLDTARAALERARAQLTQAEQATSDFIVRAPWDGIVSRLHVADGRYLAPRTPLLDMFDPNSLVLRFHVPEEHAFALALGDALTVTFDAFAGRVFALQVDRVWPELDRRLRTRTFEAKLPLGEMPFAPGQFARLTVVLETARDALSIPVESVLGGIQGKPRVFVVDGDGNAQPRALKLGFEQSGRVRVLDGLAAGERVIVSGVELVKPGKPVRILQGDGPAVGKPTGAGKTGGTNKPTGNGR